MPRILGKALDNNDLNQVESAMFALSCGIPNGNVPKAKQIWRYDVPSSCILPLADFALQLMPNLD